MFANADKTRYTTNVGSYIFQSSFTWIFSTLAIFNFEQKLKYRSPIYALTHRFTVLGALGKYYILPKTITAILANIVFEPVLHSK